MPSLGAHVSIAKSIDLALDRAKELSCDTFQIFTRSPRMWKSKPITKEKALLFNEKHSKLGLSPIVVHMPYLPNLATLEKALHKRSVKELLMEVKRSSLLGCDMVVAHMGSHKGKGRKQGLKQVIKAVMYSLDHSPESTVRIVLENTAGYQNSIGETFEDLAYVLDTIDNDARTGICFDTCHGFAAGYDLRDKNTVATTFQTLDETIGISRLQVLHLNDSKGELGGHRDRHEHIGKGQIGKKGFQAILKHPKLHHLPMILETPINDQGNMATNLRILRRLLR